MIKKILKDVSDEVDFAESKFPPYNTSHEGYAIIFEELDELWDEVKNNSSREKMRGEAVQVAATAVRFIKDLCDKPERSKDNDRTNL